MMTALHPCRSQRATIWRVAGINRSKTVVITIKVSLAQCLQAPRDLCPSPRSQYWVPRLSLSLPSLEMTPKTSAFKFGSILFTRCCDTRFFIPAQGCMYGVRLLELNIRYTLRPLCFPPVPCSICLGSLVVFPFMAYGRGWHEVGT